MDGQRALINEVRDELIWTWIPFMPFYRAEQVADELIALVRSMEPEGG